MTKFVYRTPWDSDLSVRSRPGLDPTSMPRIVQQGKRYSMARRSGSFRRLVLYVTVVSRNGLPFLGHVATIASTGIDKTSPQDFRSPGLPFPYKRVGRAL
jgi:hypothetical protein